MLCNVVATERRIEILDVKPTKKYKSVRIPEEMWEGIRTKFVENYEGNLSMMRFRSVSEFAIYTIRSVIDDLMDRGLLR